MLKSGVRFGLNKNFIILFLVVILFSIFNLSCNRKESFSETGFKQFKRIDLTKHTWHIREGFSYEELTKEKIELSRNLYRPVNKFPVFPNKIFNVPIQKALKEYTIFTEFELGEVKNW